MTKMQKFRIYPLDKYDVYAIERYNEAKDVYEVIGGSITGLDNAKAWEKDLNEKYEEELKYFEQKNK